MTERLTGCGSADMQGTTALESFGSRAAGAGASPRSMSIGPRILSLLLFGVLYSASTRADEGIPTPYWRCCASSTCGNTQYSQQEAVTDYVTNRVAYIPTGSCGTGTNYRYCPVNVGALDCPLQCPSGLSPDGSCTGIDTQKNNGPKNCSGNPINAANGNKFESQTDYSGPLVFRRAYNRFGIGSGAFGAKWDATYFTQIIHGVSRPDQAVVTRSDGRRFTFHLIGATWQGDADVADRLVALTDASGNTTGWTYTVAEDDSVESYDAAGKLITIASRSGLLQTLAYSTSSTPVSIAPRAGLLISVVGPFGHQMNFAYDANARVTRMNDPSGGAYYYVYDSNDNLASVQFPDSSTRAYVYNEAANTSGANLPNALTGIIDENGGRFATYKYDTQGRAISTEHGSAVERFSLTYGANGSTSVTDPLGTVRNYSFQTLLGVMRNTGTDQPCSSGCGSNAAKFTTYDVNGNIASRSDFNDNVTTYSYDLARNLETSRTEGYGTSVARTVTTAWHPTFRLPTEIVEASRTTTFTHDASGNVLTRTITDTSVTPHVARSWTWTYDAYGRVLTEDGPRTDISDLATYTYYSCSTGYECGQLHTVTNPLSQTTTYNTYNAHGQPLTITDPNGVVTTLTYDQHQRLTARIVQGEQTGFEYSPTGPLKKITLPDGSYVLYTYDSAHRLTRVEDGVGNHIEYTLDNAGNRAAENAYDPSSALTRTRSQVFNSLGQLWKQIGAAGTAAVTTSFGYDSNGNQTSVSAPLARNTARQYDELNRLKQVTDPGSGITQFGYNANDDLASVTDPRGNVTGYEHNGFGDLKQISSPDTGVTTNTYDSGGNPATTTDARNKTATYTYDALNRVTSIAYPDQTISFTYDAGTNAVGHLTGASAPGHSLAWTYDGHGRVTSKTQTVGSLAKSVSYAYNSAGQLVTLTMPSGRVISYGYVNNRITSVSVGITVVLTDVLYEPFGPIAGWTWGNGTLTARVYDLDGKPTNLESGGATTYSYDDAFRVTAITDLDDGTKSWSYGYDALDRLAAASRSGFTQNWTYDGNGNRLTEGGASSSTYTLSPGSNRLVSVTGALTRTYGYATSGQVTSYGGLSFTYDDAGRMTAVSGAASASYVYNALGQRIKKVVGGTTTYFVYDEAGHLIGEYDGAGDLIQEIVWMHDTPVATLRNSSCGLAIFYIHTDHLNAPRKITKRSTNEIVWRWDSDPFGTSVPNEDPDGNGTPFVHNLRFPGQYYDAESGLNYNYFRDYDPATGRYIESDPIGLQGGINTYGYVGGNPLSNIDPEGLAPPGRAQPGTGFPALGIPGPFNESWNRARDAAALKLEEWFNRAVSTVKNWCSSDAKEQEEDKNCEALYQSTLQTCASLKGRKRFACFEAARENREQCYREKGKVAPFSPLETETSPVLPWMKRW